MLFGIDAYLRQQQIQTNLQADAFFAQIPIHKSNLSAEHVDRLGAQLGLSPNTSYATPIFINGSAANAFVSIEAALNDFLHSQSSKVSGPLDPLPTELARYLDTYQPAIDALQLYLLNHDAPQWEMDSDLMADPSYPSPGFFNIRSLQKLLLLSAMQAHQQGETSRLFNTLEASWQLNKTITQRSDLSSQVLVAVISSQRASILRHLDQVPTYWQDRLYAQSKVQPIMKGVFFETWLRYRIKQNAWIPTAVVSANAGLGERFKVMFANRFSAQSYFKLTALNSTQTAHRALNELKELNVCTTPQVVAENRLSEVETARWNTGNDLSSSVVAKRWQTAGMRSLSLELSHHVLQLKARAETIADPGNESGNETTETTGTWPTTLPPIPSETCPDQQWVYTLHPDGSISLSFSQDFLSPTTIPLTYHSPQPTEAIKPKTDIGA